MLSGSCQASTGKPRAAARPPLASLEQVWAPQTRVVTLWLMICHVLGRRSL